VQSVALNGLSGSFGNIGRRRNNDQHWTAEFSYANARPTGLAAAFLVYLSDAVGLNDLAAAGYTPLPRLGPSERGATACAGGT
jgi:hypothetical protein